ncbi:transposase [Saccharospirillum alexandrii]|uniref:transposase n=1 Tax=Saccharospirillum alexandrii TaxID=2448477 RepID=UPI003736C80B
MHCLCNALLSHTESVVAILARYTHCIAVFSNGRILSMDEERVRRRYGAYLDVSFKVMRLAQEGLTHRYLQHVLHHVLMSFRQFDFLSNSHR